MLDVRCVCCEGVCCPLCGACHTPGCRASDVRCDRAVLASIGELAAQTGYVVSMGIRTLQVRRGRQRCTFSSSSEGLVEVEEWLRTMALCKHLRERDRLAHPSLVGMVWQAIREAFGG